MQNKELDFFAQLLHDLVSSSKDAYNNWRQSEEKSRLFKDWAVHATILISGRLPAQEDRLDILKGLLDQEDTSILKLINDILIEY